MASDMQHIFSSPGERKLSLNQDVLEESAVLPDAAVALVQVLKRTIKERAEEHFGAGLSEAGSILSWLSPPAASGWQAEADTSKYSYWFVWYPLYRVSMYFMMVKRHFQPLIFGVFFPRDLHCDKANNFDYDISALLYLSTHGQEFQGGLLEFVEVDSDIVSVVQPQTAELVMFTSGVESLHRVTRVTEGDRMLLSVWYSTQRQR